MAETLAAQINAVDAAFTMSVRGEVEAVRGYTIEAVELSLPLGAMCRIHSSGGRTSLAEVIGFDRGRTLLLPLTNSAGVSRGDHVHSVASAPMVWCSPALLGRVINGLGEPADELGPLLRLEPRRTDAPAIRPMQRVNIREPISTGVRAIDALHTCGLGQRMGIFSGPGVGKSTLMSMIAGNTSADVSVIALIGERGREVQEFLSETLGPEGRTRSVVVVATSDEPPLLRVRAARTACAVSEYFRDAGLNVLLLVDSLTRLCQAQRQIGLSAKEPPATRGYPPSVFSMLPEVLERAGKTQTGSITGFYTVLVEGDDFNEPIPDAVKGISDGHIWLSRDLASRGHYPAIDVLQSISRVRGDVIADEQAAQARRVLALTAVYNDIEDLVNIGAYVPGSNIEYDLAVQTRPQIMQFLRQSASEPTSLQEAQQQLAQLTQWIDNTENALKKQASQRPQGNAPAAQAGVGR